MDEVMYCEECGWVGHVLFSKKCKNCKTKMKLLPEEFKNKYNIFNDDWSMLCRQLNMFDTHQVIGTEQEELRIREELLSRQENFVMGELRHNPLFSVEAYQQHIQKERQTNQKIVELNRNEILNRMSKNIAHMQKESDKQEHIPKCPICGSTNINKITLTSRAVKTAAFGVVGAVDDAGKTYKCSNCGSKF